MCNPKQQSRIEFVSICIEQYKKANELSGAEAEQMFLQRGVIDFLLEHYEVLHTQGEQAILSEIDEYLKHHQL